MAQFSVPGWAAIDEFRRHPAAWRAWARGEPEPPAPNEPEPPLPQILRRRVTPLGQLALRAAASLSPTAETRFVFCSRHGEFERTLGLLTGLSGSDPVSPAEFSLSVHHALAALLSIASCNREGHVAIAAGRDSFAYGMVEAIATLAARPGHPVLVVYYDAPLPERYAPFREPDDAPFAVALSLAAATPGAPAYEMSVTAGPPAPRSRPAGRQARDFLRFLLGDANDAEASGDRHIWCWRRVAA